VSSISPEYERPFSNLEVIDKSATSRYTALHHPHHTDTHRYTTTSHIYSIASVLSTKREDIVTDPALLRELYSVGDAQGISTNNSQSVVQFLSQFFFSGDLQEFFTLFYQSAIGREPTIV